MPEPLTALMSAQPAEASEHQPTPYLDSHPREGCSVFHFQQPVPIPSYLLALAVGELQSRELGPMSRVRPQPRHCNAVLCMLIYSHSPTAACLPRHHVLPLGLHSAHHVACTLCLVLSGVLLFICRTIWGPVKCSAVVHSFACV